MALLKKRAWLIVVGLVVAAVAVGVGLAPSLRGGPAEKTTGPTGPSEVAVTVSVAALRPVTRTVDVVGTLEGFEEVNIAPKVEGRVACIHHDVGDEVAPGTPLVDIEDTDCRLAVVEAQRGL